MDWAHRFLDTLSYKSKSSFADGDFVYGSLSTFTGRLEEYTSTVKSAGGEEISTSHRVATASAIPEGTRVWIPGRTTSDDTEALTVLRQERAKTLDGAYEMYVLFLGR